jgi:hypothetical protein
VINDFFINSISISPKFRLLVEVLLLVSTLSTLSLPSLPRDDEEEAEDEEEEEEEAEEDLATC